VKLLIYARPEPATTSDVTNALSIAPPMLDKEALCTVTAYPVSYFQNQ